MASILAHRRMARTLRRVVVVAFVVASARAAEPAARRAAMPDDLAQLDDVEEMTDAFARDLLDFSAAARGGRAAALAPFLAEHLAAASVPAQPGPLVAAGTWLRARTWTARGAPGPRSRGAVLASLQRLLDHESAIEDVRFEITSSTVAAGSAASPALDASFAAWIVGRDRDGRREWIRGRGELAGVRDGGRWRLTKLVFTELRSLVATVEIFTEVSRAAGVEVDDPSFEERGRTALVAHGVAVADVDGDGLIDAFSTGLTRNALYLNAGDGTFREAAAGAGLSILPTPGQAPLFVDVDDDGDEDLFITTNGNQRLFENRLVPDGRLAFRDVSTQAGVDVFAHGFSAVAGDVTGDGLPDIYVACYNDYGRVIPDHWEHATNGTPNLLFVNQGGGRFKEAAAALGVADAHWSYAAALVDVDGDGDLDILSVNDFGGPNVLYLNEGGRFRDATAERGLAAPGYAMGASFGDYDDDGNLDLYVAETSSTAASRILSRLGPGAIPDADAIAQLAAGSRLYRNIGGGTFRDVSAEAGPFPGGWAWGGGFIDVDGDGREDVYGPNGFVSGRSMGDTEGIFWRDVVASKARASGPTPAALGRQVALFGEGYGFSGRQRDLLMLNAGDGTFVDVSGVSGIDSISDARGAAFADFDNDGDADVFLRAMHGSGHLLFRNDLGQAHGSVRVSLQGTRSGRDAWGAVVRMKTSAGVLTKTKAGGSGFLSQSDPRLLFGLGDDPAADWMEVAWPSGLKQRFKGPRAGDRLLIVEGEAQPQAIAERRFVLGGAARRGTGR